VKIFFRTSTKSDTKLQPSLKFPRGRVFGNFGNPICQDRAAYTPAQGNVPQIRSRTFSGCILRHKAIKENIMTATQKKDNQKHKIDLTAPAGSENSLGAESVRDGRPTTDDSVVEAIDEVGPGIPNPSDSGKGAN
jgi:hypothetical protein